MLYFGESKNTTLTNAYDIIIFICLNFNRMYYSELQLTTTECIMLLIYAPVFSYLLIVHYPCYIWHVSSFPPFFFV